MLEQITSDVKEQLLDQEAFIQAFRRHAAGVVIITGLNNQGNPVGFTATSLASLSAEPPRATFNIAQTSSSWTAVNQVGNHLAIHFLGANSVELAKKFATKTEERFQGDHWESGKYGLPIVKGATAVLYTSVSAVLQQSANAVVVLDIESGQLGEESSPLLYHERQFHTLLTLN